MCENDCQYDQTGEDGRFDRGRHVFKNMKLLNKACLPFSAETDQKGLSTKSCRAVLKLLKWWIQENSFKKPHICDVFSYYI